MEKALMLKGFWLTEKEISLIGRAKYEYQETNWRQRVTCLIFTLTKDRNLQLETL